MRDGPHPWRRRDAARAGLLFERASWSVRARAPPASVVPRSARPLRSPPVRRMPVDRHRGGAELDPLRRAHPLRREPRRPVPQSPSVCSNAGLQEFPRLRPRWGSPSGTRSSRRVPVAEAPRLRRGRHPCSQLQRAGASASRLETKYAPPRNPVFGFIVRQEEKLLRFFSARERRRCSNRVDPDVPRC